MDLGHSPIIEVLPTLHGISEVGFPRVPRVLVAEGRCCPTLGHHGVGLTKHRLTDQCNAYAHGTGLYCCSETSSPSPNHDDIVLMSIVFLHLVTPV